MEVSFHLLRPLPPSPSPLPRRPLVFPLRRPRLRPLSFVRNSADDAESTAARPEIVSVNPALFGAKKELTPLQAAVDAMAPPVRLASSLVVVAGALAAGYGLGCRLGGSRTAGAGGAAALGAAGGAVAYAINSCAPEVAAVNLHNYVAGCDDPGEVKREVVEVVEEITTAPRAPLRPAKIPEGSISSVACAGSAALRRWLFYERKGAGRAPLRPQLFQLT